MEYLADTWVMWLALNVLLIFAVVMYRRGRSKESSFFITAKDLSMKTLLLDVRRGDGDIFLGFLFSMVFFSMFLAGFIRWIRTIY